MLAARKDTQFGAVTQVFSRAWWGDPPSDRKAMVSLLRSLEDESGKPLFTHRSRGKGQRKWFSQPEGVSEALG